jgi:imidazolonepropionase-like amidohydrolase
MFKPWIQFVASLALALPLAAQDLVVRGERVHTVSGAVIENGIVIVKGGKIVAIGNERQV